ncbi:multidrug effflux MFS transporter [uncultured Clostridium sp.]|uniref:multidrug effflux MFS transporter n=1 Tax=uncultured Clostridium sp. TaxID=59620 RepID=UPI00261BA3C3|nr:multidrug effflux MFS transporter [uncultured Clostridium sp.]
MNDYKVEQKILKNKGFIIFVGFLSAFVPMSTDLYLPALPSMINEFHTNVQILNLTITFFFLFYAISMLFWGPLSDKHGRRKILSIGMILYTIGSFLCFFAKTVDFLIIARILQAIGSGSAVAVSTAMMKDVFVGKKLVAMLATVQSIAMTTPVIAPIIGSFILEFTSWHGIFLVLTIVGIIAVIGSLLLTETLLEFNTGNLLSVFSNIITVGKNPRFSSLLVVFSINSMPMMAYITMSSYIYINGFKLSDQVYSLFYSCTGLFLVIGPLLYIKLSKKFKDYGIITTCFIIVIISGILLQVVGFRNQYTFILTLIPAMLFGNMLRPPGTNLMLLQQDHNIGSASSLISFASTIMGSIGMFVITFNFGNKIVDIGFMYLVVSVISLVLWLIVTKTHFVKLSK